MTQTSLFDLPASRPRKRGQVTRTSVEAGRAVNRDGRVAMVSGMVEWIHEVYGTHPTSAEVAGVIYGNGHKSRVGLAKVLHVRRGLSDALRKGFVEHAGERTCAVSGRTCVVWKLKTR